MANKIPKHVLKMTRDEKLALMNSFDVVFSDCDGVLWTLTDIIKNSGESIQLLKKAGKRVMFVSNNSIRSEQDYMRQFQAVGIETDINDLVHPHKSILGYLKRTNFRGLIYCVGIAAFKKLFKDAGYEVIDGPDALIEENFKELIMHVFEKQPVKAVIMDIDFNLSAVKLMKAAQFLKKDDCILISGATGMTIPVGEYGTTLGHGPYLKILEEASNKKAKILGKPGKEFGELLMENQEIDDPKRVLFIGDMLAQDVKFGRLCGFQTLLVLSGGTTKADLMNTTDLDLTPDYYADSLADFIEFFISIESNNSL